MKRTRASCGRVGAIVGTLAGDRLERVDLPGLTDHVYAFSQGIDSLSRTEPTVAHPGYAIPESACTNSQPEAPAAQRIQRRGSPRKRQWRPQREAGDVRTDCDSLSLGSDVGDQGRGVQERGLVGVVLETDEIQPRRL